jgi:hypothetical protein
MLTIFCYTETRFAFFPCSRRVGSGVQCLVIAITYGCINDFVEVMEPEAGSMLIRMLNAGFTQLVGLGVIIHE